MARPFSNAKLVFDEPLATYYAGQILYGHIECELKEPVNVKGIFVTFLGEAITEWDEWETEEYNGISGKKNVEYKAREEYFNVTQPLYGGTYVTQMPAGDQNLPFSFLIPSKVPSTFSASHGRVRYLVSAFIDYADQNLERDILEKEFEVVVPFDLNTDEGRAPTGVEFEENYTFCCSTNTMNLRIKLPHAGYCPGQKIPVTITAQNATNEEVKSILFELVQRTAFRSFHPYSEYVPPEEVIQEIRTGPILRKTYRKIYYEIPVPGMIVPNLDNCDIIDLGYALKVTVQMSGCKDNLTDECDVVLGLIPVEESAGAENYKHPMADRLPRGHIPKPAPNEGQFNSKNKVIISTSHPSMQASSSYSSSCYLHTLSPHPIPYPGRSIENISMNDVKVPQAYPSVGFVVSGISHSTITSYSDNTYPNVTAQTPLMPRQQTPEPPSAPPMVD